MANVAKRSFSGGELTPEMYARTDQVKFATGLKTCRNYTVLKHGGLRFRPGLEFCLEVKTDETDTALRPFIFNKSDTALLEFGERYVRIIQDGAYLTTSGILAWVTATAYTQGDLVTHGGVTYYCQLDHTAGATTEPGVGVLTGSHWYAQTGNIYEVPSPYDADDVRMLKYAQSADVITFTHYDYPIYELRREDTLRWRFVEVAPEPPLASPTNLALAGGTAGSTTYYAATAVRLATGEEGLATTISGLLVPSVDDPIVLTLDPVSEATDYNIYKSTDGATFGFIGRAAPVQVPTFEDVWVRDTVNWSTATPDKTWVTDTGLPAQIVVFTDPAEQSTSKKYTVRGQSQVTADALGEVKTRIAVYMNTSFPVASPLLGEFDLPTVNTGLGSFDSGWRSFSFEVDVPYNVDDGLTLNIYPMLRRDGAGNVEHNLRFTVADDDRVEWDMPSSLGFTDYDTLPDYGIAPPIQRDVLSTPGNFPDAVTFNAQRRVFANSLNEPETIWASHVGGYNTFMLTTPVKDDSSNVFAIAGQQVNEVRHMLDLNGLCIFTANGEYRTESLIPGRTVPVQVSQYGTVRHLRPLIVGNRAVFVQAHGRTIYDLAIDAIENTRSREISVFSTHLFEGHTIEAWDYQYTPDSIVWAVRDDGVLLGATIQNEHEILAWHRHDTDGDFIDVCVIPENGRDVAYFLIDRVINGVSRRYIERFVDVIANPFQHCDSFLQFSNTDTLTGLDHLEGKNVSVVGDRQVIASPHDPDLTVLTVTGGEVTLPAVYTDIVVGLPYIGDFETLDIDAFNTSRKTSKMLVNRVMVSFMESRGLYVGPSEPDGADVLENLYEVQTHDAEGYNDDAEAVYSEDVHIDIDASWNSNGDVFFRHIDPTPCTILAVVPQGNF